MLPTSVRWLVLLGVLGCGTDSKPRAVATPAKVTPAKALEVGESERATFVTADWLYRERIYSRQTVTFTREAAGWRLVVDGKSDQNDFHYDMTFDAAGRLQRSSESHLMRRAQPITWRSETTRDADGHFVTHGVSSTGEPYTTRTKEPADSVLSPEEAWFTACLRDAPVTRKIPSMYDFEVGAPEAFATADQTRALTKRTVRSRDSVVAVIICDGERLAGVGKVGSQTAHEQDPYVLNGLATLPELAAPKLAL